MFTLLVTLLALPIALHLYRQYWSHKDLEQLSKGSFDGQLYRNGETIIAVRSGNDGADKTVICFPGFLEDMRYFQALYENAETRLILVNNADYHCPFPADTIQALEWEDNPYPLGTIEHDGFQLVQVIRALAPEGELVLHGHSRGGAVVLEAGRQSPTSTILGQTGTSGQTGERSVSAVLEAAVLPQARIAGRGSEAVPHRIFLYLLPIMLGRGRKAPRDHLLKHPMMRPTNPLKNELCSTLFSNARHYSTCVTNVRSIRRWQAQHSFDLFSHYGRIVVLVGERDSILDKHTMLTSAEQGRLQNPAVEILQTQDTNHFISLEQPHYVRTASGV